MRNGKRRTKNKSYIQAAKGLFHSSLFILHSSLILLLFYACSPEVEHLAEPIAAKDSLLFMHSSGINTFISDSGVIRYHMVVEEWDIYNGTNGEQPTWKFVKGMLMERFDEKFHVDLFVQSDTAYLHRQQLWELRGRVVVRNVNGDVFRTEELFWDLDAHEMWNHSYMHIKTPERELEGTDFHSNEQMTKYYVLNSEGSFPAREEAPPVAPSAEDGGARGKRNR